MSGGTFTKSEDNLRNLLSVLGFLSSSPSFDISCVIVRSFCGCEHLQEFGISLLHSCFFEKKKEKNSSQELPMLLLHLSALGKPAFFVLKNT
jgi:hypothetical protein